MAIYQLRNLDKWVQKVKGDEDKVVRAVALQITNEFINRTRVRYGTARGNWHAELNAPAINIERDYVGTPSEAAQHSLSKCTKAIAEAYGKRLFITNNIEYIEHLESLDSMVRGTVLEFNRAIDAAVKGLK